MPRITEIIANALGGAVIERPGDVPLIVVPKKGAARKPKEEKTYSLKLTYAELEALLRATHSGTAEMLVDYENPEDRTDERCADIRQKVSDKLDEIDAAKR